MTKPEGTISTAQERESHIHSALPHLGTAEGADLVRIVDALVRALFP